MNHTENQIIEIAKKVLKDIEWKYNSDKNIKVEFIINDQIFPREYPKNEGWIVWAEWFNPDFLGGKNTVLTLVVDDETGLADLFEPHSLGQGGPIRLKVDQNGKYYIVKR